MVIEGLLSTVQVAERMGCSIPYVHNLVAQGKFPVGKKIGQHRYWQPEQIDEYMAELQGQAKKAQEQTRGLLSSEQVARQLSCTKSTLSSYVKNCKFPPGQKIGKGYYWRPEQVSEYFAGLQAKQQAEQAALNSQTWLTRVEVAEHLHYTPSALWHLIKTGKFPVGTKIGDRYYHTQAEVDEYLAKQRAGELDEV